MKDSHEEVILPGNDGYYEVRKVFNGNSKPQTGNRNVENRELRRKP